MCFKTTSQVLFYFFHFWHGDNLTTGVKNKEMWFILIIKEDNSRVIVPFNKNDFIFKFNDFHRFSIVDEPNQATKLQKRNNDFKKIMIIQKLLKTI